MIQPTINYLAVLVAAVASMVLGSLWYSPLMFGKLWMQLSGINMKEAPPKSKMMKLYGALFVSTLVMVYVLAHMVDYAQATTAMEGAQAGFWIWLGFVATVSLGSVLWENKPVKLYLLNNAFQLVSMMLMGVILEVWA